MGYVTPLFARKMVAAAGDAINGAAFLRGVGIDTERAWDPKAMIPDGVYYDMLEEIAAEVDVTELPSQAGASMRLDEYAVIVSGPVSSNTNCAPMRAARYSSCIAMASVVWACA